ncbi:MAG: putative 2-hydroxyacid dehydrogenase [candidate division WS2 bacterium ADurb.Bin280]|uniref:Putative 2-hydroxyacid dehydrogenase n=1 Tax=candidate division WS2 bacterium ADurb.Bin280 TaxID=1852829 RepID=A0A1V5SFD0_9BACT|nr:MAG: putative 2-hydroxyacid dehydrogenase [candidate division WS2 bacterium ADurb.Bin280]
MKKIFIARNIDEKGINLLKKYESFDVEINKSGDVLSQEELIERAKGCEAIVTLLTDKIDAKVLDGIGSQLKIVANYAVGFDNIDLQAAKERNIEVTNTPDIMTQAVAEHAMALILACARRVEEGDNYVRAGKYKKWESDLLLGPEIAGKTLGIIGMGNIGIALASIGYHGFGMKILYSDPNICEEADRNFQADRRSLNELLEHSDFISLHVPLLESTHHLISEAELKKMKKTAILVNTARGPIIDEKALAEALEQKEIFAAGIDVFEFEPEPVEKLKDLQNIIMTPHIASATHEAREAMSELVAQNIIEVLHSRPAKTSVLKK